MLLVSVIVPCYNEEKTIRLLLEALYYQTFPRKNMEVIIADGLSKDRTRQEIATFQKSHPDLLVQVVDNTKQTIPAGLNRAIENATGEYIVRLDAHSVPERDYIERCVSALEQGKGANVGGVWDIRPGGQGSMAKAIAIAAAHPFGVGDAHYRFSDVGQNVDTVPFGAFKRSLVDCIGKFDESLLTNEDYEFNVRVRQSGGKVWLDPDIRSTYFARPTLPALARQYWRYGFWKARMLRRYPETMRWRQALPPLFLLSLFGFSIMALFSSLARWVLALEIGLYILVIAFAGIQLAIKHRSPGLITRVPLAIATMHLAWGMAFIWSMLNLKATSQ